MPVPVPFAWPVMNSACVVEFGTLVRRRGSILYTLYFILCSAQREHEGGGVRFVALPHTEGCGVSDERTAAQAHPLYFILILDTLRRASRSAGAFFILYTLYSILSDERAAAQAHRRIIGTHLGCNRGAAAFGYLALVCSAC